MLFILCFNLKNGISEEEFVNKLKEWSDYAERKVEGFESLRGKRVISPLYLQKAKF